MIKELWIKMEPEGAKEVQDFLLSLAEEGLLGEIPVVLYNPKTDGNLRLSHIYDVDEAALLVLKEKYGDRNVSVVTKEGRKGRISGAG